MVTQHRKYREIADRLAKEIAAGVFKVGQRLPSERDLAQRFEVSRPVIREAIIALEMLGIVSVRAGSGITVERAGSKADVLDDYGAGPFELIIARRVVESECAALAAASISDEEIVELEELVTEMQFQDLKDVPSETPDEQFHLAIAKASGNSVLEAFVRELWRLRRSSMIAAEMATKAKSYGLRPPVPAHAKILDAIRDRNPGRARKAMQEHIEAVFDAHLQASETEAIQAVKRQSRERRSKFHAMAPIRPESIKTIRHNA